MAIDFIGGLRLLAGAFLDHFVHEAAAGGFHLGVLGHLGQELLAFFLSGGACNGGTLGSLVLELLVEGLQGLTGLFHADLRLGSGEHIFQSLEEVLYVCDVNTLLVKAGCHAHSKCI